MTWKYQPAADEPPIDREKCRARAFSDLYGTRQCQNRHTTKHSHTPVCGVHKRMLVRQANSRRRTGQWRRWA